MRIHIEHASSCTCTYNIGNYLNKKNTKLFSESKPGVELVKVLEKIYLKCSHFRETICTFTKSCLSMCFLLTLKEVNIPIEAVLVTYLYPVVSYLPLSYKGTN